MHVSMNRIDNKYIEAICYFDSKYRFISGDERYFAMMGEVVAVSYTHLTLPTKA